MDVHRDVHHDARYLLAGPGWSVLVDGLWSLPPISDINAAQGDGVPGPVVGLFGVVPVRLE